MHITLDDAILTPYISFAVSEILNALINIYKQLYRVSTLTDAVLFSKYPQTALALDEVLKEVRSRQGSVVSDMQSWLGPEQ